MIYIANRIVLKSTHYEYDVACLFLVLSDNLSVPKKPSSNKKGKV